MHVKRSLQRVRMFRPIFLESFSSDVYNQEKIKFREWIPHVGLIPKVVPLIWRYIYDKIQFTEMAIQLVESGIQQVKFDKKKATKGEKH